MKTKDSFEFMLSSPITYSSGGEHKEGQLLVLTAPTNKQHELRIKLKQAFQRAIMSLQKSGAFDGADAKADAKEKDEVDGDAVASVLFASDIDMVQVHSDFKRLLLSGVCKVEDAEAMTQHLYDQMTGADTDKLLGQYMAVFIK